jgi:hypothetical protein
LYTYLSIFLFLGFSSFFLEILRVRSLGYLKELIAYIIPLILIIFSTLRKGTGTDYYSYEDIWKGIRPMDFNNLLDLGYEHLEPGFRIMVSFIKLFTDFDRIFYLVMSLLAIIPTWLGLRKICSRQLISGIFIYVLIFYIPYVFNGMRQAIAMGLFIYSIEYIKNRKFLFVMIIALLAISIHFSGIIILISYLAFRIKVNPIVFFIFGTSTSFLAIKIINVSLIFQTFNFNVFYLEEINFSTSLFQLITRFIIVLVMILSYYFFFDIKRKTNHEVIFLARLINIYLLGLFIYIYFKDLNVFATRINMFFRVLEIIIFPIIFNNLHVKSNRVLMYSLILFLGGYIFLMSLSVPENEYNYYFLN